MVYHVACSVCDYEDELPDLETVLDAQEEHRSKEGTQHLLEFEKV